MEERCFLVPTEKGLIVQIRARRYGTMEWFTSHEFDVTDQAAALAAQARAVPASPAPAGEGAEGAE